MPLTNLRLRPIWCSLNTNKIWLRLQDDMVHVFVQNLNLSKCSAFVNFKFTFVFFSQLFFLHYKRKTDLRNSHNKNNNKHKLYRHRLYLTKLLHVHSKQGIAVHLSFQRQHNGRQQSNRCAATAPHVPFMGD